MKAKIKYVKLVEKEIEVPDHWQSWAENDWNDYSVYHEIEDFWNNIEDNELSSRHFKPVGIYYGDNDEYYIAEY